MYVISAAALEKEREVVWRGWGGEAGDYVGAGWGGGGGGPPPPPPPPWLKSWLSL